MAKVAVDQPQDLTPKKIIPSSTPGKLSLSEQRERDSKPVRGIFRFHECPGGTMAFSYFKYKGDKVQNFTLTDGEVHTIPLGVAKHLNTNGWYPEYEYIKGEGMQNVQKATRKVRRFSFQSLEFTGMDEMDGGNRIITVERV